MLKFAVADVKILDSFMVPAHANRESRRRIAHRHHFAYTPRPGYLYVRSRMISSRCNDNFDEFPAEEIEKGYRTFIGKPVFVNHHNEDHRRMRGVIIDAALHRDKLPTGAPDTWVEGLMEVDALRFPRLASAIVKGDIDRTSMGCDVDYSVCSVCDNKATNPAEYCKHIPRMKGQRIYRADPKTGKKEGILVREICYGLRFFENSLLVEEPADPTAFFTGVDTSGLQMAASKTAMRDQATCPHDGSWNLHGQCTQCGWSAATEDDEECDHPLCKGRGFPDGWHTKGEHVDPEDHDPHSDFWHYKPKGQGPYDPCTEPGCQGKPPHDNLEHITQEHGNPDMEHLRSQVEDAFGGQDHGWLLDQQHTGPTKWSSLQVMASEFTAAGVPFDDRRRQQLIEEAKQHVREVSMQAQVMGHEPQASNVGGAISVSCKHCPEDTSIAHTAQGFAIDGTIHSKPCEFNPRSPAFVNQPHPAGEKVPSQGFGPSNWLMQSLNSMTRHFATLDKMAEDFSIPVDPDELRAYRDAGEMRSQMHEHGQKREVNLADPIDLKSHMLEAHDLYPEDMWRNSHEQDHEALDEGSDDDRPLRPHELRALHEHDHHHSPGDYPGIIVGDSHFHSATRTAAGGSNDAMVTCDQGHEHWGAGGAAGLLLRHRGHDGQTRYLLQKRGPKVDSPNTYSIPGGALAPGETPVKGAIRECQEEMGALPNFRVRDSHLNDHGGWAYTTVIADVDHRFDPPGAQDEHAGAGWYTPQEIDGLKLHPGFEASWGDIKGRGN